MLKIKEIKDHKKFIVKMIKEYESKSNTELSNELRNNMILIYEGQLIALKTVLEIKDQKLINKVFKL
jgi:hypothetical protein